MGIKGLKKYIDSDANTHLHITENIPYGSRLHVDGNGWMFHLMQSAEGLAISRQYGGSYIEYDSLVRKRYHGLINHGISLSFYFDGADSHMKSATKKERSIQRGESWMNVYNATVSRNPKPDQKILDLPPFTKQQFVSTLESLGAPMIFCKFEADQEMVLACNEANIKSKPSQLHYCFGDDTDYLVMKDCPYIVFGTLKHRKVPGAGNSRSVVGCATVWRRKKLALNLGFKEEQQLVEWSILIGNDYTKHFPKSSFTGFSSMKPSKNQSNSSYGHHEYSSIDTMRKFIISQKPSYRLTSIDAELELSITYSREVYNLSDLTQYEELGNRQNGAKRTEVDEESSDGYSLSSIEKNSLTVWRKSANRTSRLPDSVGTHVINFLKPYVLTSSSQTDENDRKPFAGMTSAHLEAFVLMLKNVNQEISRIHDADVELSLTKLTNNLANTNFFGDGKTTTSPNGMQEHSLSSSATTNKRNESYLCPKWENVRAARTYQLLCSRFFEKKGREENLPDRCTSQPMHLYDGKMFHRAMEEVSAKNGVDASRVKADDTIDTQSTRSKMQRLPDESANGTNGHSTPQENGIADINVSNGQSKPAAQNRVEVLSSQQQEDDQMIEHYSQTIGFDTKRLQRLGCEKLTTFIEQINDMKRDITMVEACYVMVKAQNGNKMTAEVIELREAKKAHMVKYKTALEFKAILCYILECSENEVKVEESKIYTQSTRSKMQRLPDESANGTNGHSTPQENGIADINVSNGQSKPAAQNRVEVLSSQQQEDDQMIEHYSQTIDFDTKRLQRLGWTKLTIFVEQINGMKRDITAEEKLYMFVKAQNGNKMTAEVIELREAKKGSMIEYKTALKFKERLCDILENSGKEIKVADSKRILCHTDVLDHGIDVLRYLTEEKITSLMEQIPDLKSQVIASEGAYVKALRKNDDVRSGKVWKLLSKKNKILDLHCLYKRTKEALQEALLNRIDYKKTIGSNKSIPVHNHARNMNQHQENVMKRIDKKAEVSSRSAPANNFLSPSAYQTRRSDPAIKNKASPSGQSALPIDEHRKKILDHIERDRVTIIQGETGCGKSSRLPVMLLEDADSRGIPCRIMVTQPRRIAASSLTERLRPSLGKKVGLRMGDDVKDEFDETVIHFVTCGYILKLMAHQPGYFSQHTHIIIDEVHERSIEGDALCMITRKLLNEYPKLRLILMSATMETSLHKEYFADVMFPREVESIFVGVRCFPLQYHYLEDVLRDAEKKKLPYLYQQRIQGLIETTKSSRGGQEDNIPLTMMAAQEELVMMLVKELATLGSDILIFVSGLSDIISLSEKLERFAKFQLCYIHSEIPYEDQAKAFLPAIKGKIKIIISNNTAVSSVTFPDVNTVICLGTHKALQYSPQTHTTFLCNTWISKSTATQRAGRTGRVRPGVVYRLYSKRLHDLFDNHDPSEIFRRPLQDVILEVWTMTEDSHDFQGIIPTIQDLPEAPLIENIDFSLKTLHKYGMTTDDKGEGYMTTLGRFSGAMPLDLRLGMLIHYGIALGIGAESIVFAAALSQRSSLFKKSSFLMKQQPTYCNDVIRKSFLGSVRLDNETYSEPVSHLTAYKKWTSLPPKMGEKWAKSLGIRVENMKKFAASVDALTKKVNSFLGRKDNGKYESETEIEKKENMGNNKNLLNMTALNVSHDITARELNLFRLILTWVSADNILRQDDRPVESEDTVNTAQINRPSLSVEAMQNLFPVCEMLSIEDDKHWKTGNLSIPLNVRYEGTTVYEAELSDARCEIDPAAPIINLFNSVADSTYSIDNIQCTTLGSPIVWIFSASNTTLYIACQPNLTLEAASIFEAFGKGRSVTCISMDIRSVKIGLPHEWYKEYVLIEAENVTKSELNALSTIHSYRTPVATMVIPLHGNAKVTASNYRPTAESLRRIFFDDECSSSSTSANSTVTGKVKFRQVIEFGPTNMSSHGTCTTWKDTDTSDSNLIQDPSVRKRRKIEDCDVGLQLMNSYLQTDTRTGQLILRIAKAPRADSDYNIYDEDLDNFDKVNVSNGCISKWQNIGQVLQNFSKTQGIKAVMPRHSVSDTTVHQGVETLYGVAFTSLITRSHKLYSIVDGVTLLPPGGLWISLAMTCVGVDPQFITSFEKKKFIELENMNKEDRKDKNGKPLPPTDFKIGKYDFSDCKTIQKYLGALGAESLKRDDDLISAIDYLFAEWI